MPIEVEQLAAALQPERTVLLFGAGSSLPSGAPSVGDLQRHFEKTFGIPSQGYNLSEQSGIIENRSRDRARLIAELRKLFLSVRPTGAILNLPLYEWKSIYTTNYDKIVEESYERRSRSISVYSSNFDFSLRRDPTAIQYLKLHGTIDKDVSDGSHSRIILTQSDYDQTSEYRQCLWDRLKADLAGAHLLVLGHSLGDRDVKDVVDRAHQLNREAGASGKITVFMYTRDDGLAGLYEARGIDVCFGGLDDLFAGLAKRISAEPAMPSGGDPLDQQPALRPATIDVAHSLKHTVPNVSAMFNGWPASYADISAGLTFQRDVASMAVGQLKVNGFPIAVLLGPSGVGKTTAARQTLADLGRAGFSCWEHKADQQLVAHYWRGVAKVLEKEGIDGCLFVDDAHLELDEINALIDDMNTDGVSRLRLVLASSRNHWYPRVKTPALHKKSHEYQLGRIQNTEIDRLLDLVENTPEVRKLVEQQFGGFSRQERRRRLVERCEADMFVCLKNIFASEKFDDIVLREYADLPGSAQDVYRIVAAMEYAGVRVHRQLVIRLLGVHADAVKAILSSLEDIIHEETVNGREGIYAWYGRHKVIVGIIAEHKYYDQEDRYRLFDLIISNIQPSYDIEIKTINELCNVETGLSTIVNRDDQNILLRKMLSVAPGQRVPRHRLIRNLIALHKYDEAEAELRLFESDFRLDGPACRYKIELATTRALHSPGIMDEDRIVLLKKAREMAAGLVSRHRVNKAVLAAYCELGVALADLASDFGAFDEGIALLRAAEGVTGDADIPRIVSRLERRIERVRVGAVPDDQLIDVDDVVPIE